MKINQVVLWGHKLHSHTHSYIHYGFIKAFEHMGYKTLWLDNNDIIRDSSHIDTNIDSINFSNSLFITEGQVDANIPIRDDCYYILHNCDPIKYKNLPKCNVMVIQVFTLDVFKHKATMIDDYSYYIDNCLFMYWATDLLPHEIDDNINKLKNNMITSNRKVCFIGMMTSPWNHVENYCIKNKYEFIQKGGFSKNNVTGNDNMMIIQQSLLAPAVQNEWQVTNGYVPCRIFKNISYGKMGMTNNMTVYNIFNKRILYSNNINKLMDSGIEFERKSTKDKNNTLIPLMEYIRDNHTYINRINMILNFFVRL